MAFTTSSVALSPSDIGYAPVQPGVLPLSSEIVEGAAWDAAVSRFDDVCQEQLFAYARLRWPNVGLEPVIFSEGGTVLGGALVMLQRLPMGVGTIALIKFGPMLADARRADGEHVLARMVETLIKDYAERRGMMISVLPKAEKGPENRVMALLEARGFRQGVGVNAPMRYVVELELDDGARMGAFGQKWRYNLRKSMKAGLDFRRAGPEEFGRFLDLYAAMSARKLFPDHSGIATAQAMMAMPESTARPELFFVDHGGKTVAGAVIFTAGDTASYLYGATDDAALDLRAGYFIHWNILGWLRDNTRARFYDLGGTDGFAGLAQFKSGMVGEAGYIAPLPPALNFATDWRALAAGTLAYRGRYMATRGRDRLLAARLALKRAKKAALGPSRG